MTDNANAPETPAAPPVMATTPERSVGGDIPVPSVELIGERAVSREPRRLLALFSIGLALSIAIHAALLGAGLVRMPRGAPPDEEALPVTVVPEPDTAKPAPTVKPPQPAPQTEAAPKPAPQSAATQPKPAEPQPQKSEAQPAPNTTAPASSIPAPPAAAPALPAPPQSQAATPPPAAAPAAQPSPLPSGAGGPGETAAANNGAEEMVAALREQIARCWTIPTGWTSPHQVTVVVDVRLDRTGAVTGHPVLLEFSANPLGMAAAKNALAAVGRCAPYKLPADKYSQWREAQVKLTP